MLESRNTEPPDGSLNNIDQLPTENPTEQNGIRPKSQNEARRSSSSPFSRLPRSLIEQ